MSTATFFVEHCKPDAGDGKAWMRDWHMTSGVMSLKGYGSYDEARKIIADNIDQGPWMLWRIRAEIVHSVVLGEFES